MWISRRLLLLLLLLLLLFHRRPLPSRRALPRQRSPTRAHPWLRRGLPQEPLPLARGATANFGARHSTSSWERRNCWAPRRLNGRRWEGQKPRLWPWFCFLAIVTKTGCIFKNDFPFFCTNSSSRQYLSWLRVNKTWWRTSSWLRRCLPWSRIIYHKNTPVFLVLVHKRVSFWVNVLSLRPVGLPWPNADAVNHDWAGIEPDLWDSGFINPPPWRYS